VAGVAYVIDALTKIAPPQAAPWTSMLTTPAEATELAVIAWAAVCRDPANFGET